MAELVNQLLVWVARFLFLALFCNQFRRAPFSIYGLAAFYISYQVKEQAELNTIDWAWSDPSPILSIPNLVSWSQAVFFAGLTTALLSHQPRGIRYLFRGLCVVVLIGIILSHGPQIWDRAFPFAKTLPFWFIFVTSGYYHYRDVHIPADTASWQRLVLSEIKSFSTAFKKTSGLSSKVMTQLIKEFQHSRAHEDANVRAWKDDITDRVGAAHEALLNNAPADGVVALSEKLQYHDLSEQGIRLLEVQPPSPLTPQRLQFRFIHSTLPAEEYSYTALSYCWGTDPQTELIYIDQMPIKVTPNLYHALREVSELGYTRFWVDAICINQSNIREKNAQILRIFRVFQAAREVVAWLGKADQGTKQIMHSLQERAQNTPSHIKSTEYTYDDLKQFTGHAFWRRIWIIQEVAAAMRVYLVCGGIKAPLDTLESLINETYEEDSAMQKKWPQFLEERELVKNILEIRERNTKSKPSLSLLEALTRTKASRSSQMHDRVYGLLGLVTDRNNYITEPNYELTKDELCLKMTIMWIKKIGRLDIILAAPRHQTKSSLPSWCPDYLNAGTKPFSENIVKYISGEDKRHRMGEPLDRWRTTEPSKIDDTIFEMEGNFLHVTAIPIGMINGVGPLADRREINYDSGEPRSFQPLRRETTLLSLNQRRRSDGAINSDSRYNAICRLLLLYDPKYSKFTAAPTVLGMLYHFLFAYDIYTAMKGSSDAEEVQDWLKLNEDFRIHDRKLKTIAQASAVRMSSNFIQGVFSWSAKTMMFWHYTHITKFVAEIIQEEMPLMTTYSDATKENGIGWAHPEAALSDEVFMIAGCSLPVILRKSTLKKDAYEVVGHAYVDGYMDGKKWENSQSRAVKVKIC